MIKAYFFDWFLTLGDSDDNKIDGDRYLFFWNDEIEDLMLTKKFDEVNLTDSQREDILRVLGSSKHWTYQDSEKFVKNLKSKGYKLALVSNTYEITSKKLKKQFSDFFRNFDVITFSSDIGMRKPNKEIFIYTLDKLNEQGNNIKPQEVMMIGNSRRKDFEPALALGMQAKLIDRNKQTLKDVI